VQSNSLAVAGNFELKDSSRLWVVAPTNFICGGDMTLTNGAIGWIFSGPSVGAEDYGSKIEMGGTLGVATNCALYVVCDAASGVGPLLKVGQLSVDNGGVISASGAGYAKNQGPGGPTGWTAGGTHGGSGGGNSSATYGSEQQPVTAGSGGDGTAGGGVVRIDASPSGRVMVDGAITADGVSDTSQYNGKGAGGSIYIRCRTFSGGGSLFARGGSGAANSVNGGGGGRIAIWRTNHEWTGVTLDRLTLTAGGTGTSANGQPGTLYLGYIAPKGTMILIQ